MFRIDNSTAVTSLPAIPGVGTPGYFSKGNPATAVKPTIVDDWWLNTVQEEILTVVVNAGITPSKVDRSQLYQAIQHLISLGAGDGGGTDGPYLPLAGGQLHAPSSGDLLSLYVDTGFWNRIIYTTGITRTWAVGVDPSGNWTIADQTANAICLTIAGSDHSVALGGKLVVGSGAQIYGQITTNTISASGAITAGGDMTTSGNLHVAGSLYIDGLNPLYGSTGGWLNMSNNFNMGGQLTVNGPAQVTSLAVANNATIGTLSVNGLATMGSALNITGTLGVSGYSHFFANVDVGGVLGVTGQVHAGSTLQVDATAAIAGYTTMGNNCDITGTLGVTGTVAMGSASVGWALNVGGPAGFANNLTVSGNIGCNDITINGQIWIGGTGGVAGSLTLSGNLGANHGTFGGNCGVGLVLSVSGNANIGGTVTCNNLVQTSDERLKGEVRPLVDDTMLDGVKALRPVSYILRDSEQRSFGFLASEVAETPLGGAVYHNEADGLDYVSYSHLLAAAIGAIQRLDARVAALGG